MSATHRLFIGLFPPAAAQQAIVRHRRRWAWPEDRSFPQPERLHLTLHFLGEWPAATEPMLLQALATVAVEPLELVLRAPVSWGNVAVILPDHHQGLHALHARIGEAIGARPRQKFEPHVTLARKASQAFPPEASPPIVWNVREFRLVWSQLPPLVSAPHYEVLGSFGG